MMDTREPYDPLVMGYSVHRQAAASPSSTHQLAAEGGVLIAYAIWYDWDIQHLYDLEHIWVRLDGGRVTEVTASFHGQRVPMDLTGGLPALQGDRPVIFAEPGKHAHWADPVAMRLRSGVVLQRACGSGAGREGVHRANRFYEAGSYGVTRLADRLARLKMMRDSFTPSFRFVPASQPELIPWCQLEATIPDRVKRCMDQLPDDVPHLAAVFLDCGDTLIDESTEVKEQGTDVTLRADEIPGATEAMQALYRAGIPMVLVADGPRETFENLLKPRRIWELFSGHVVSGDVGALKPDARMFDTAMKVLGLKEDDRGRIVMVGNNLARDICGARRYGLRSLAVGWSARRSMVPAGPDETPDARIDALDDLPAAIEAMELAL